MDAYVDIVKRVIETYAVKGINFNSHLTISPDGNVFTVIDIMDDGHSVYTSIAVRLLDEFVVIDHDDNSEPLVEALTDTGIPSERIILAYAGERVAEVAGQSVKS